MVGTVVGTLAQIRAVATKLNYIHYILPHPHIVTVLKKKSQFQLTMPLMKSFNNVFYFDENKNY